MCHKLSGGVDAAGLYTFEHKALGCGFFFSFFPHWAGCGFLMEANCTYKAGTDSA